MKNFTKKQKIIALSATLFISGILLFLIPTKQNTNIPSVNINELPNVSISGNIKIIPGCIKSESNDCSQTELSSNKEPVTTLTPEEVSDPKIRKPLEQKLIKDSNGVEYDSNQYKEAPVAGKEPKWNFGMTKLESIKYGASTATYNKCQACHGTNGMQSAFNKSTPIYKMTTEEIISSLESYKSGSLDRYGQGKVMFESTKNLSKPDFISLANQIKSLDQDNNPIDSKEVKKEVNK